MRVTLSSGAEVTPTERQAKDISHILFGTPQPKTEERVVKKRKRRGAVKRWQSFEDNMIAEKVATQGKLTGSDVRTISRLLGRTFSSVHNRYQAFHKQK